MEKNMENEMATTIWGLGSLGLGCGVKILGLMLRAVGFL